MIYFLSKDCIITLEFTYGGALMSIISFFVFVCVNSFTPGPNNILAMTYANQYGLKRTLLFCLGVGTGFSLIIIICSFFNVLLMNALPIIELPLALFGIAYMLYLAFIVARSGEPSATENKQENRLFFTGVVLQFINPKGLLFGLTVVTIFIIPYYSENKYFLLFALILGAIGVISSFSWSLFGSLFKNFLTTYRKPFNLIMAALLVYVAFSILIDYIA